MVLSNPIATAMQFPFIPDDLGPMVAGGTPVAKRMRSYAGVALNRFRERFGRAPANDLETATAMADWVATVMKHPEFWPADPSLPRYNPLHDPVYNQLQPDPLKMLEYTLQFDPNNAETWPSPQCGHQNRVVIGLLNSLGIYGRMVALQLHTGLEFFSFRLHKWIYIDATHNEHYVYHDSKGGPGIPLNAAEIHALTLARRLKEVDVVKHGYPGSNFVYLALYPQGFLRYAVTTYMKQFGEEGKVRGGDDILIMVSEDIPRRSTHKFWSPDDPNHEHTEPYWFDLNGVRDPALVSPVLDALGLAGEVASDSTGIHFTLKSALPYTASFQESLPGTKDWEPVYTVASPGPTPIASTSLNLGPNAGVVRFRAVDTAGNATQEFIVNVE
jgi:hypothetical protein